MAVALLVAAGHGERLGADGPKAFVVLAGRPMLEWSLEALRAVPAVERIVVALPAGVAAPAGTVGVAGGAERSHSVRAALALAALAEHGCDAVVAAARVTDTIKRADGDELRVVETLDRSALWAVQTPQVFRRAALARALAQPDEVLAVATDDAGLVEQAGGRVHVVESPSGNLKVTTPTDLRLAELLLGDRPS
jgi:2-C-methyl-D-erythritol 4-phosphate cytidylyltransferase